MLAISFARYSTISGGVPRRSSATRDPIFVFIYSVECSEICTRIDRKKDNIHTQLLKGRLGRPVGCDAQHRWQGQVDEQRSNDPRVSSITLAAVKRDPCIAVSLHWVLLGCQFDRNTVTPSVYHSSLILFFFSSSFPLFFFVCPRRDEMERNETVRYSYRLNESIQQIKLSA